MAGIAFYSENIVNDLISDMEKNLKANHVGENISKTGEILGFLRNTVKENGDFIHFTNKLTLFKEFYHILTDGSWEVRNECLQLISDLIPICGEELDQCMEIVMPAIINNMGHYKVVVRRSTIHTLHAYMKQANNVQKVLQAIVSFGLESKKNNESNQEYIVLSLPMLLTPEFDKENYLIIVEALASQLQSQQEERCQAAFFALQKIKQFVGEESFMKYLHTLNPDIVEQYRKFDLVENNFDDINSIYYPDSVKQIPETVTEPDKESLEYGIIPQGILRKLNNEDNWNVRCQGIEALKHVMLSLSDVSLLIPYIADFILLLNRLLTDVNFKITTVALDIYKILIDKMKFRIRPHLNVVTSALSRQLADSKLVVRSKCIKTLLQLMQCVSPMPTIIILTGNLQQKNSRLREETINLITAALLTFPSYEFDLLHLCNSVASMILDPKRKIRQAVLECLAVISQALGPAKSSLLIEIIDNIQRKHCTDRIVLAVQGRIARRILPRVTADGLVEYSVHIPYSASKRSSSLYPQGADVDWILAGSGSLSSGSASGRTDSVSTSSGTGSTPTGSTPHTPVTMRRILSPGSNKNRLPWEETDSGASTKLSNGVKEKTKKDLNDGYTGMMNGKKNNSNQPVSKYSEKQMYLQKLRHSNERKKEKVRLTALGVSILPDRPVSLMEGENSVHHFSSKKSCSEVNLSSTWPLNTSNTSFSLAHKKVLDPIHSLQDSVNKPVPTKPSIMRSSSAHRHQRVPPLNLMNNLSSLENELHTWKQLQNIAYSSSSQDSIDNSVDWETDFSGSMKFEMAFPDDNVISSKSQEQLSNSPIPLLPRSLDFEEIPFNSKPVIMRSPSLTRLKSSSALSNSSSIGARSNSSNNSINNNNSLIAGINNENSNNAYLPTDQTDDDDGMNIIGRGMVLRNSAHSSVKSNSSLQTSPKNNHLKTAEKNSAKLVTIESFDNPDTEAEPLQSLTFELKDKQSEPDQFSSEYHSVEESTSGEEEQFNMSMSQSTRDRLLFKKQEMLREAEKKKSENDNWIQFEQDDQLRLDEEEDEEEEEEEINEPSRISETPSLILKSNGISRRPLPNKSNLSRKYTASPPSPRSESLTKSSPTSVNVMKNDSKPLKNPESGLSEVTKLLNGSQWTGKCEGIQLVRRLACHHPEILLQDLHNITVMLLREVKNLRSSVSRAAIICFGCLFTNMKRYMETDLDNICKVLLHKSGDSNKFIQEDVEKSLTSMVEYLTPSRVGIALISGGANHKNASVRKLTAQLLSEIADKLGPAKILSGIKDITDKFLPVAAQFVTDCSPLTRYYGRKIFFLIIFQPNFDEVLEKYVSASTIRNIRTILDGLKRKGLGEKPNHSPSGRFRR